MYSLNLRLYNKDGTIGITIDKFDKGRTSSCISFTEGDCQEEEEEAKRIVKLMQYNNLYDFIFDIADVDYPIKIDFK
jgi:hypothetical protein